MSIFRKRTDAGEVWKSHVLAKMGEPHCWVCAQSVSEVDRDFFWFVNEQYYEIGVVDKMRLAHGFCPTHTRHFLQTNATSVITTVFSYLTWYVIRRLNAARDLLVQGASKQDPRRLCLQVATALRPQGICPMCQSLRQSEEIDINALVHALALTEVKEACGQSPGLCLPHFRQAGYRVDLYSAGHDRAAILIGKRTIHEWLLKLDELAAGLSTKPAERSLERLRQGFLVWSGYDNGDSGREPERPQPRWRKVAAVLESPQARLDALRAVAFRTDLCQACTYVYTITRQRLDLILRALEEPVGRKAYHTG